MYYDLLAKLKNGARARKETILTPFSRMDFAIAKVLADAGYVKSVEKRMVGRKGFLEVTLAYKKEQPVMSDFRLVSKPSRHLYKGYREMRPIKQGYGLAILSTPQGVMTDKDAKKQKIGGEHLFNIW